MRASKKIIIVSLVLSIVALPALSQAIHEAVKNGEFSIENPGKQFWHISCFIIWLILSK